MSTVSHAILASISSMPARRAVAPRVHLLQHVDVEGLIGDSGGHPTRVCRGSATGAGVHQVWPSSMPKGDVRLGLLRRSKDRR